MSEVIKVDEGRNFISLNLLSYAVLTSLLALLPSIPPNGRKAWQQGIEIDRGEWIFGLGRLFNDAETIDHYLGLRLDQGPDDAVKIEGVHPQAPANISGENQRAASSRSRTVP